jgi:hypothetical protein
VYLRRSISQPKKKISSVRGVVVPLAVVIASLTVVTLAYEIWQRRAPTWKAVTPAFTAITTPYGLLFDTGEICLSRSRKGVYVTRTVSLFLENEVTASFKPEVVHLEYFDNGNDRHPLCFNPFAANPPTFKFPEAFCQGQDNLRGAVTLEMKHINRDDPQVTLVPLWEGKSRDGVSQSHSVTDVVASTFHGPPKDVLIVPLIVKCVATYVVDEPHILVDPVPPVPYEVPYEAVATGSVSPKEGTEKNHEKAQDHPSHEKHKHDQH